MNDGKIQVYTGEGKGKTTASIGLIVRALGAGLRVCFIQFDKGSAAEDFYSERKILRELKGLDLKVTGKLRMMPNGQFRFNNTPPDFEEAQKGLKFALEAVGSGKYDMVVCDEILSCVLTQLLSEKDVLGLLDEYEKQNRPCELVLTGRSLSSAISTRVDLVTEMKMVKHYFNQGLKARKGIEF